MVVAASPDFSLCVAVLRGRLGFVQALECAVMPLVQLPALRDGIQSWSSMSSADPQRFDGPLQDRRERDVEDVSALTQQPAGLFRLPRRRDREINVGPAGEPILSVPRAFAVTKAGRAYARTALRPAKTRGACRALLRSAATGCTCRRGPLRLADPVLICPAAVPTARSAIVVSSVSPERCEMNRGSTSATRCS